MTFGCIIDLYFVTTLEWDKCIFVLITTILAVFSYVCAKIASGFKSPTPVVGKAVTLKEIKLGPSICHCFAHGFVSISHYSMLYFIHGSPLKQHEQNSQAKRSVAVLLGLAPLIAYLICIFEWSQMKLEGGQLWIQISKIKTWKLVSEKDFCGLQNRYQTPTVPKDFGLSSWRMGDGQYAVLGCSYWNSKPFFYCFHPVDWFDLCTLVPVVRR